MTDRTFICRKGAWEQAWASAVRDIRDNYRGQVARRRV